MAFNEKHENSHIYCQQGEMAEKNQQWFQAKDYYLKALNVHAEYQDTQGMLAILRKLSHLQTISADNTIPAQVANVLGISVEEAIRRLEFAEGMTKKIYKVINNIHLLMFIIVGLLSGYYGYIYWGIVGGLLSLIVSVIALFMLPLLFSIIILSAIHVIKATHR